MSAAPGLVGARGISADRLPNPILSGNRRKRPASAAKFARRQNGCERACAPFLKKGYAQKVASEGKARLRCRGGFPS